MKFMYANRIAADGAPIKRTPGIFGLMRYNTHSRFGQHLFQEPVTLEYCYRRSSFSCFRSFTSNRRPSSVLIQLASFSIGQLISPVYAFVWSVRSICKILLRIGYDNTGNGSNKSNMSALSCDITGYRFGRYFT